jgi:hypothetical protein
VARGPREVFPSVRLSLGSGHPEYANEEISQEYRLGKRKRKAKVKRKKESQRVKSESSSAKGFDFGDQAALVVICDPDFNKALVDAAVFSCGYGYQQVEGFPGPIPLLTLVGENADGFKAAFKHFARWGCVEDGDAVDIHMMLRVDGSYQMWIGPELQRSMYRLVPQASLYQPSILGVSWVKKFDSTHPFVRELKEYCESAISPVSFAAAIGDPRANDANLFQPVDDLPRLIKFELKIVDERQSGDDPRFSMRTNRRKLQQGPMREPMSPQKLCMYRKQSLDIAFPVSRERIRRSELTRSVRELAGFPDVTEVQVVQAAVNLMLSSELVPGDRHYSQITRDLSNRIWNHVAGRFETANGERGPIEQEPAIVARQLELDVRYALMRSGIPTPARAFAELQALFRRKGYVDD